MLMFLLSGGYIDAIISETFITKKKYGANKCLSKNKDKNSLNSQEH